MLVVSQAWAPDSQACSVGRCVGDGVGVVVGASVGVPVGRSEGAVDGVEVGSAEGMCVGAGVTRHRVPLPWSRMNPSLHSQVKLIPKNICTRSSEYPPPHTQLRASHERG